MPGKPNPRRDEKVSIPLDPETALRALLAVEPDEETAADESADRDRAKPGGITRINRGITTGKLRVICFAG